MCVDVRDPGGGHDAWLRSYIGAALATFAVAARGDDVSFALVVRRVGCGSRPVRGVPTGDWGAQSSEHAIAPWDEHPIARNCQTQPETLSCRRARHMVEGVIAAERGMRSDALYLRYLWAVPGLA